MIGVGTAALLLGLVACTTHKASSPVSKASESSAPTASESDPCAGLRAVLTTPAGQTQVRDGPVVSLAPGARLSLTGTGPCASTLGARLHNPSLLLKTAPPPLRWIGEQAGSTDMDV